MIDAFTSLKQASNDWELIRLRREVLSGLAKHGMLGVRSFIVR